MGNFCLSPGDILVNVNARNGPFSSLKRWAVGPYEHVFMYFGHVGILVRRHQRKLLRFPMIFESDGDGVVVESVRTRFNQEVVVLRLKSEFDRQRIPRVLEEAVKLATDPQSYYDYLCIIRFVLPRIILEKLRLPMPLRWHRDARQICSEAVYEVFYRAKLVDILPPYCTPPLPGDFVTDSILLEEVWRGTLSADLISLEGHAE